MIPILTCVCVCVCVCPACENCVELDKIWVAGLALGDVVATIAIGVAVYLIASHGPIGPVAPQRKSKCPPTYLPSFLPAYLPYLPTYLPFPPNYLTSYLPT